MAKRKVSHCLSGIIKELVSSVFITVAVILIISPVAQAVGKLEIDYSRNQDFLPYTIQQKANEDLGAGRREVLRPIVAYQEIHGDSGYPIILAAVNRQINRDEYSYITSLDYSRQRALAQMNTSLTISNLCVFFDGQRKKKGVAVACYKNDSAFVVRYYPTEGGRYDQLYLISGVDHTGDGEWQPMFNHEATFDYDYDGKEEVFYYLDSGFDLDPRVLFCIEMETFRIEWSLPVASSPASKVLSCNDPIDPSVIFVTYGPQNGVKDSNFDDSYGYVTRVNKRGEIVFHKIIAHSFMVPAISPAMDNGSSFYLLHFLPLTVPNKEDNVLLMPASPTLSKIDRAGNIVKSTKVREELSSLWMAENKERNSSYLYSVSSTGVMRIYNDTLELLYESNPTNLLMYLDSIRLAGQSESAFIFRSRDNSVDIYSHDLEKLAVCNHPFLYYEPLRFDNKGDVDQFVLTAQNRSFIGGIKRKNLPDYVKIIFCEYREYMLMLLSGLMIGLIVTNYYRRRTKTNLRLISSQKKELEQVHQQLKEAQAQIIADEKYRQAKNIAGGVAHEINNALCPALNSLSKLQERLNESESSEKERNAILLDLTEKAINRAIKMTELVRIYSSLEFDRKSDVVNLNKTLDEVIDSNNIRIRELRTPIGLNLPYRCDLRCNRNHLYIVFNNLILNALDALTDVNDRHLSISSRLQGQTLSVEIVDTGVGIAPEYLDRIYDAFYSTKPRSGTGLGLAVVKRIVELYDWRIEASSLPGKGTKFTITFPCANH